MWLVDGIQLFNLFMVYGRILYNNIREYTPKSYPTIPFSQTVKPTFGRQPQVVSKWNAKPMTKQGWRLLGKLFNYSWAYQIFMFGLTFGIWLSIFYPCLWLYQYNNRGRTFESAMIKERAHKKKLKEIQEAQEAAQAAAEAAAGGDEE